MLIQVISGAQSGADIAGLKAAKEAGLLTGGHMPKGFKTSFGPRPEYKALYNIEEHPSPEYPPRTEENVKNSDGTIRLAFDFKSPGEKLTLRLIKKYNKPFFDVDLNNYPVYDLQGIVSWIIDNKIHILNVAGNSEKTSPGTERFSVQILKEVFKLCISPVLSL